MSIRALNNSYFAEREIRSLAEDEDSNISKLIYRKAAEHGSGHVCSCSWSVKSKNEVTELKAEWFPKYEVAPVDAEGSNLISETIFKATKNNKISAAAEILLFLVALKIVSEIKLEPSASTGATSYLGNHSAFNSVTSFFDLTLQLQEQT